LKTISMAGAASTLRLPAALAADGPPEITSVRLMQTPSICAAPQLIVGDLLRDAGFTDIRFVYKASNSALNEAMVRGEVDFSDLAVGEDILRRGRTAGDPTDAARRVEPDMRGHHRHEEMLARPERGYPNSPTLEVGDAADVAVGEQLEAADMHAGQHSDRTAAVDKRDPFGREVQAWCGSPARV
jgi:hypothetical protein